MERFCGSLQPAIKSRRYPYASIDNYIVATAQLSQIKLRYNLTQELSLLPPTTAHTRGEHQIDACKSAILCRALAKY